jgi:hypothetical protein
MPKPEEAVLYYGEFIWSFNEFFVPAFKKEKIYNSLLEQRLCGIVAAGKYEYYVWGNLGIRLHLCSRVVFCSSTCTSSLSAFISFGPGNYLFQ